MRHIYDFAREHVHWFPSHMRAAVEKLTLLRPRVDIVIDVRDARVRIFSDALR